MQLTLTLSEDTAAWLLEKAKAHALTPEEYLARLVRYLTLKESALRLQPALTQAAREVGILNEEDLFEHLS